MSLTITNGLGDSGPDFGDGIASKLRNGLAVCAVTVLGLGGFAATFEIAGAVVAGGAVIVETSAKRVQHPTGGVVGQILVKDGDLVKEGDVVLRLDETLMRANLMVLVRQMDELSARSARLAAERDGLDAIVPPASLAARLAEPEVAMLIAEERRLFEARRDARSGQRAQLVERITQLRQEVVGLEVQQAAKAKELTFVAQELQGARDLWQKNLYPVTRYVAVQRDAARLEGERGQLISSIAQIRGKIAETELQVAQIEQDLRSEVLRDLRDLQGKQAELSERRIAAEDQLRRVELRAPQGGVVHQLTMHTVGGVIAAGDTIMQIVPQDDELVIEARISPNDIDSVHPGQPAMLRFTAFNQRTTPTVAGIVDRVSADLSREQTQPAQAFYTARVTLTPEGRRDLKDHTLLPGMPTEVHLQTGERTILSYLVKPMRDQISIAFRER